MSGISVLCHLLHLSSTSYLVSPTYHKAVLKSSVSYLCCLYSTDPMLCGDRAVSGLGVGKSPAACPGSASWRASEEQSSLILEKKAQIAWNRNPGDSFVDICQNNRILFHRSI